MDRADKIRRHQKHIDGSGRTKTRNLIAANGSGRTAEALAEAPNCFYFLGLFSSKVNRSSCFASGTDRPRRDVDDFIYSKNFVDERRIDFFIDSMQSAKKAKGKVARKKSKLA